MSWRCLLIEYLINTTSLCHGHAWPTNRIFNKHDVSMSLGHAWPTNRIFNKHDVSMSLGHAWPTNRYIL